jgi:hypothetical protein
MTSRTTDDYESMYGVGVRVLVEPAFWLGQPRTSVDSFIDYFDGLIGWERFRAAQFGIRHHATMALNPKEANDPRCVGVLDILPRYLAKDGVVAVGEVGYDSMTPEEDFALSSQLELAIEFELPVLVHTPHRDKRAGTQRTLDVLGESGLPANLALVDHLNETTVGLLADSGCWMGFSIYPDTKMDAQRMVDLLREYGTDRILINSAADWPSRCWKPGSAITTWTPCCGVIRWISTASPDGSISSHFPVSAGRTRCSPATPCNAVSAHEPALLLHQCASGGRPPRDRGPARPLRAPGA